MNINSRDDNQADSSDSSHLVGGMRQARSRNASSRDKTRDEMK
jgi:hypothetical protein|tara:strand:- start:307 stop:435 length:129 start_codon:yes stop_codon:yes gene_type:complete